MALSFPLSLPTVKCALSGELRPVNAVAQDQSPFAFDQSVHHWGGEMWQADVTLPPMDRADAEEWLAFITSLRGRFGTFLMGDPRGKTNRGTATSGTISGTEGSHSPTVSMGGSLLVGDYFQLGLNADSKLYKVMKSQTGSGTLEIWPALRHSPSAQAMVLSNPVCVFRLGASDTGWTFDQLNKYGVTFPAIEAI